MRRIDHLRTRIGADLLQQQTALLLRAYCDLVELVDEVTTERCHNDGEMAPVRIEHASISCSLCELCAASMAAFVGHEITNVEVRRLP